MKLSCKCLFTVHFHKDVVHTVQQISKESLFRTGQLIQSTGSCKCLLELHFQKVVLHTLQQISEA